MAEENPTGFKVTDRRLFNPDGTPRMDVPVEEVPSLVMPYVDQFTLHSDQVRPIDEEQAPPDEDPNEIPEQTMFTEFLMGIASSAFVYLGLVEHPATRQRQINLPAAKESIEMLMMLRDKTKGNLTAGEEKFFDDLLADLRMQFVSLRS